MANDETSQSIRVQVGEQEFRVRVLPEERARFQRAEQVANRVLNEVLASGVVGGVRAYAMACFQLALETDEAREAMRRAEESRDRLGQLIRRIDRVTEEENKK
jgi:hypothetical protein